MVNAEATRQGLGQVKHFVFEFAIGAGSAGGVIVTGGVMGFAVVVHVPFKAAEAVEIFIIHEGKISLT